MLMCSVQNLLSAAKNCIRIFLAKSLTLKCFLFRDHAQISATPAISLVDYNVIPSLIGRTFSTPTSIMDHLGERTRPCPFPVTGNGHGRVTEPENDQFCGRSLGTIPNRTLTLKTCRTLRSHI